MVTKSPKKPYKNPASPTDGMPPSDAVKDSAQQIWQAGLGAFTRAQAEGSKAFEALVKEGVNMQRKTQAAAEQRLADATHKMTSMATEISSKATGQWDKLENIFEDRVAKALHKLGVPTAGDVEALMARMDALHQAIQDLGNKITPPVVAPAATRKPRSAGPARKIASKTPPKQ